MKDKKKGILSSDFMDDFMEEDDPLFKHGGKIPASNILDKTDVYEIEVAAPGLKKEYFKVTVESNRLVVLAEVNELENKEKKYYSQEFGHSALERSFNIPSDVDQKSISSCYNEGILFIRLPKQATHESAEDIVAEIKVD
ncbi:Hsp20/alpha crystallin family protein [Ilyobacter sp.]|uniref:Hsp20/alpha crystallin family protein n=1 Tax=Ilyobacter sp. TaxID=3100343 RepID=UPI0035695A6B